MSVFLYLQDVELSVHRVSTLIINNNNIRSILDGLSVTVDGAAKAEVQCHDNKDSTCAVTWIPPTPGEYNIHVRFAGKPIHGSPFIARVAGKCIYTVFLKIVPDDYRA